MSDEAPKRRGGRPNRGKRGTFTFRVTDTLRQKLEAQSATDKRPVSEIIEARLEISFSEDRMREMMRELLDEKLKGSIW